MMGRNASASLVVGVTSGVTPRPTLSPYADVVLDSIAEIETVLPAVARLERDRADRRLAGATSGEQKDRLARRQAGRGKGD